MVTIEKAQEAVLSNVPLMPEVKVPLAKSLSRALAEDVSSDIDMPPFDTTAMDGYAVRGEDVRELPCELEVVETITAGMMPAHEVGPGQASAIMTGAPMPGGADTVVIVEETERIEETNRVRVRKAPDPGVHVRRKGEVLKKGDVALEAGAWIRPAEVAVLAAVGRAEVPVRRSPSVGIMTTGDEIVEVDRPLDDVQIRDSNSWAIAARLRTMGIGADRLGVAPDSHDELAEMVAEGLKRDLLILSGGVSAGVLDLVPGILADAGVEILFDRVRLQPGKPTVFGRHEGGCVFGLPGNPVSVQVTMELFVVPAVRRMMGMADALPHYATARLTADLSHRGKRTLYQPVRLSVEGGHTLAEPVDYRGSGDLLGYARAQGLAVLPEGTTDFSAGDPVRVLRLPGC